MRKIFLVIWITVSMCNAIANGCVEIDTCNELSWIKKIRTDEAFEQIKKNWFDCPNEGDTFVSELAENKRLLDLYTTRLQYLRDRDPRLELVRAGETRLYEHYEQHFLWKIREFGGNVAALERRLAA